MRGATGTPSNVAGSWLVRTLGRWPASRRRRIGTILAIGGILVATIIASSRMLRSLHQELDILAYAGLFAACWIGAGGALVPVPGVRPVSWFMIVQQGAALDPVVVALVAATAMALGQTSYFVATRMAQRRARDRATPTPVSQLARDSTVPSVASGRSAERLERARRRVTRQVQTHGIATVFAVCALPTPLTTLTTTAAAVAGMGFGRYVPSAFGGFLVLSSALVLFGQGLGSVLGSLVPFR